MSGTPDRRRLVRWLQRAAAGVAVASLSWAGFVSVQAAFYDHQQRTRLDQARHESKAPTSTSSFEAAGFAVAGDGLVGLLEIPRLGFSEIVAEGDDNDTLRIAIGHLPDTPLPWRPGNSAFAGHRDGRFRPLKDIKLGDTIRLSTSGGDLNYVLRKTMIVTPDDVWVLKPTSERVLTLITCYPFSYVGKAPKRFVMVADAVDGPGPLLMKGP